MGMKIKLTETENELLEILDLQKENHFENIPNKNNGFVTVCHDLNLLKKMNKGAKQIIAVDNKKVVGYALVMLKEFKTFIPVLMPMFSTFHKVQYKNKMLSDYNYYVMGQICIANSHRRKGILKKLYAKHKEVYSSLFDICLTEVSSSNILSMKAHISVGFKTVFTFKDSTDEWNILLWDWR